VGVEDIGGCILGDEVLKGLALGDRLLKAGRTSKLIEESPRRKEGVLATQLAGESEPATSSVKSINGS
jgi:hypothetical protein